MNRREMIGTMGLGAAALSAAGIARAQQRADDPQQNQHLETLANCARICNETAHHCLEMTCKTDEAAEREKHAKIHEATMDCQAFCVLTATLMARHSPMGHHAHAACAEACAQCAKICEETGVDSAPVRECIKSCRECEEMCRQMAEKPQDHHHHDNA